MEKNSLFTKERANFAFNKINRYYLQHAYRQALEEIELNRELTGSSLNVGSQLKLGKIYTDCVIKLVLDAFEVDGDLSSFEQFMAKNRTHLELHADRDVFLRLMEYHQQKDKHPNYKSRTESSNQTVAIDDSQFEDGLGSADAIKSTLSETDHKEIQRNFLDAIESPSFHFSALSDGEDATSEVIKSNVDVKAIHDDFFGAIGTPGTGSSLPNSGAKPLAETQEIQPPSEFNKKNPFAQESSNQRKKKNLANKGQRANSPVKERIEVIKDGKKITQTTHKSGGIITEFTVEKSKPASEASDRKEATRKEPIRKEAARKQETRPNDPGKAAVSAQAKKQAGTGEPTQKKNRPDNQSGQSAPAKNIHLKPFLILMLVVLLGFGGYKMLDLSGMLSKPDIPAGDNAQNPSPDSAAPGENPPDLPSEQDTTADNGIDATPGSDAELETPAQEQAQYILPSNERELTEDDFAGLTKKDLRLAINEMFARYGWNFGGNGELFDYFSGQAWYTPDFSMTSSTQAEQKFTATERRNLNFILNKYKSM